LCVDEDLLDPDDRLRERELDRPLEEEEEERLLDLDEEPFELPERLLLLDFRWGILPVPPLRRRRKLVFGAYPNTGIQTLDPRRLPKHLATVSNPLLSG
jgi:hypothetical protein